VKKSKGKGPAANQADSGHDTAPKPKKKGKEGALIEIESGDDEQPKPAKVETSARN
jgi:hypothetical protein